MSFRYSLFAWAKQSLSPYRSHMPFWKRSTSASEMGIRRKEFSLRPTYTPCTRFVKHAGNVNGPCCNALMLCEKLYFSHLLDYLGYDNDFAGSSRPRRRNFLQSF